MEHRGKKVEFVVQTDYGFGHGWEDSCTEESFTEAKVRLKEYRNNQPEFRHRVHMEIQT